MDRRLDPGVSLEELRQALPGLQVPPGRDPPALWKVSDESTRELMERFYENLWEKKLGKLESLRQAQLEMLDEPAKRGIALEPTAPQPQPPRRPPYDWAAFVLSGDWR